MEPSNSFGLKLVYSVKKQTHFRINIVNFAYLGTGDFRLLDHDEGRGDQGSLSDIVNRVVGHGLQKVDRLLHREK